MTGQKPLEILIVEDNERHIQIALEELEGHNVTIAKTYREAARMLGVACDGGECQEDMAKQFDMLLTDLFIPYSDRQEGPCHVTTEPRPLGTYLMLMGVARKIPYIALVTDTNHHACEEGAAVDGLQAMTYDGLTQQMGKSRVVFGGGYDFVSAGKKDYAKAVKWLLEKEFPIQRNRPAGIR
jgi:CheY-like chemotaxis protein